MHYNYTFKFINCNSLFLNKYCHKHSIPTCGQTTDSNKFKYFAKSFIKITWGKKKSELILYLGQLSPSAVFVESLRFIDPSVQNFKTKESESKSLCVTSLIFMQILYESRPPHHLQSLKRHLEPGGMWKSWAWTSSTPQQKILLRNRRQHLCGPLRCLLQCTR